MCTLGIHHITHIDNLDEIIKTGLLSRNFLNNNKKNYKDTANHEIIEKRNTLNNYVPFHINKLETEYGIPYTYQICSNRGKQAFVVLSLNFRNYNQTMNKLYLYHPVSYFKKEIMDLSEYITKINEEPNKLPKNCYGKLDFSNGQVQQFLMSEVLIKDSVPFDRIDSIYVFNEVTEKKVNEILKNNDGVRVVVKVDPNFFK